MFMYVPKGFAGAEFSSSLTGAGGYGAEPAVLVAAEKWLACLAGTAPTGLPFAKIKYPEMGRRQITSSVRF